MSLDVSILLLRMGMVLLLFLFLGQVLLLVHRDLRRVGAQRLGRGGRLRVLESVASNLSPGDLLPLLGVNSLGRSQSNTLLILDDSVSSEHLLLSQNGGDWRVEDLGSTNGTYLNGHRVDKTAILAYGDAIQLGKTKLRLERSHLD